MKGKIVFCLLTLGLATMFACAEATPVFGPQVQRQALRNGPPRVIVVGQPGASLSELGAATGRERGQVHRELALINALSVTLPDQAAVRRLRNQAAVLRLDDDVRVWATARPDRCSPWPECKNDGDEPPDPPTDPQETPWGVTRIGADQIWGQSQGDGVAVVIIDTGIDPSHPDLNVAGGINFTRARGGKPSAWRDDNGHGTHVAGTVAALDNDRDVVGVAPAVALYACKALDRSGSGYLSDVIACIDWAVQNGFDVANMSLGSNDHVQSLQDACDTAAAAGLLLVAAAGNDGDTDPPGDSVDYPGRYSSTIAVGATDVNDASAYFSSYGAEVEVSAPGVDILSTYPGSELAVGDGTSMAAPHVAGALAVLMAAHPELDAACLRQLLSATADDLGAAGRDDHFGNGLINLPAALVAAAGGCTP